MQMTQKAIVGAREREREGVGEREREERKRGERRERVRDDYESLMEEKNVLAKEKGFLGKKPTRQD